MSPMIASDQPDKNLCPAASEAARPAVGETLKLNRIRPNGPRTPPPCSPAAPLKRDSRLPSRPRNSTRRPSQRSSASIGSIVTASTTSDARYRPAMATGGMPALRPISTPSGIPAPICVTNTRKTPHAPAGQSVGSGAVGSNTARVNWLARVVRSSLDIQGVGGVCRPEALEDQNGLARTDAQEGLAGQGASAARLHEAHQTPPQLGGVLLELGLAHSPGQLAARRRAGEHGVEGLVQRGEIARSRHRAHLDVVKAGVGQRALELAWATERHGAGEGW